MTKKVVGEEVHEDTTTVHTRAEAEAALGNAQRRSARAAEQMRRLGEEKEKFDAEVSEWETAIAALPALPEPAPEPAAA